jgi:hypothetical protein
VITVKELGQVLPHPNACLPRNISMGIYGWPTHYPSVHPLSKVGYRPTRRPSKILSLRDPIITYALVHDQRLFLRAQPTWSLIDTGEGYHLRSSEHENRPLSPFPSGILQFPLVAPPGIKLWHKALANINHLEPPS